MLSIYLSFSLSLCISRGAMACFNAMSCWGVRTWKRFVKYWRLFRTSWNGFAPPGLCRPWRESEDSQYSNLQSSLFAKQPLPPPEYVSAMGISMVLDMLRCHWMYVASEGIWHACIENVERMFWRRFTPYMWQFETQPAYKVGGAQEPNKTNTTCQCDGMHMTLCPNRARWSQIEASDAHGGPGHIQHGTTWGLILRHVRPKLRRSWSEGWRWVDMQKRKLPVHVRAMLCSKMPPSPAKAAPVTRGLFQSPLRNYPASAPSVRADLMWPDNQE